MSQFLDRSGAGSDCIDNEMSRLAVSRVASSISLLTIKCSENTGPGHVRVYYPSLRVLGYLQWYIELYSIPPHPPKPVVIFIFPPHLTLGKTWLSSLRLG